MEVRELDADQVRTDALARTRDLLLAPVDLEATHAHGPPRGEQLELLVARDRSGDEASGDDRAEAGNQKSPVDRQPDGARLPLLAVRAGRQPDEGRPQLAEAFAGHRGHRDDRRLLQEGPARELAHVARRHFRELAAGAIDLRHGDDSRGQPEQPHDVEVLARLRHDGLVRRDDEQHRVDPSRAREHVAHETLVPGHVHE